MLLDSGYSNPLIAGELEKQGASVAFLPAGPRTAPATEALWTEVERDSRVRAELVRDHIDLWPAAAPELERIVTAGIPRAATVFDQARRDLLRLEPQVALVASATDPDQKARCAAARSLGIPVAVARHGDYATQDIPFVAYQDPEAVDSALCWGTWEASNLARHAPPSVETVVVGAPMVEEAVRRAPTREEIRSRLAVGSEERVVLYASTNLSGDDWYASRLRLDDDAHFERRLEIARTLAAIPGTRLVIKAHPAEKPDPIEMWASDASATVIYEPPFSDLINLADAVVLDAPGTTLAQALFGEAPIVLVEHPVTEWEPGVREHLVAHGVALSTPEALEATVEDLRRSGGYSQAARQPFVAGGPEPAATRAARALLAIASGKHADPEDGA